MKQLPSKLRQLLSERDDQELKQGTLDHPFGSHARNTIRSPNRQVTLDTLARGTRSRPSTAGKRVARMGTSNSSKDDEEDAQAAKQNISLRHESAPKQLLTTNPPTTLQSTIAEDGEDVLTSTPSGSSKASSPPSLARRMSAPTISGSNGLMERVAKGRITAPVRSSPKSRRRSSISLGNPGSPNKKKTASKKKREQARREARLRTNDRLRAILGAMSHRKTSAGWESWKNFVKAHRHRDLSSSAISVLQHTLPAKRNPTQIQLIMKWIQQSRLECLRPLVSGHGTGTNSTTGNHGEEDDDGETSLLAKMSRRCTLRKYKKGEVMFWQTEFGDHYHIVVQGQVGIYANPERGAAAKHALHMSKLISAGHTPPDYSKPAHKKLLGRWWVVIY